MKRKFAQFALFLILCFALCIPSLVKASAEDNQYTVATAVKLMKFLTCQSDEVDEKMDINLDGKITGVDLTLLKRIILNGESITSTTTTTTLTTTKESFVTTTTTSTVVATTTTVTTVTTTETTLTTSTTMSTTTMTTTTTVSSKPEYTPEQGAEMQISAINACLSKITPTDTTAPKCSADLTETKDGIFLFDVYGTTYAYKFLVSDPSYTSGSCILNPKYKVAGLHIWKYTGSMQPKSATDALPSTSGLKFKAVSQSSIQQGITEVSYRLKKYSTISIVNISTVSSIVSGFSNQSDSEISQFDYNLNGLIDSEDLSTMIAYWSSDLTKVLDGVFQDTLMTYIDNLPDFIGHDNIALILTQETKPVDFAFQVTTQAYWEGFEGEIWVDVVQMLPISYKSSMSSYKEQSSVSSNTGSADYIAWNPAKESDAFQVREGDYAYVDSSDTDNWRFQSGFYVYLFNSDGSFRHEWNK